jgi:hypothetical protein
MATAFVRSTNISDARAALSAFKPGVTMYDLMNNGIFIDQVLRLGFRVATLREELAIADRSFLLAAGFKPSTIKLVEDQILALVDIYEIDALFLIHHFGVTIDELIQMRLAPTTLAILGFTMHRLCMMGLRKHHIDQFGLDIETWVKTLALSKFHLLALGITAVDVTPPYGLLRTITSWTFDGIVNALNMRAANVPLVLGVLPQGTHGMTRASDEKQSHPHHPPLHQYQLSRSSMVAPPPGLSHIAPPQPLSYKSVVARSSPAQPSLRRQGTVLPSQTRPSWPPGNMQYRPVKSRTGN